MKRVYLRHAKQSDSEMILIWRNDPVSRSMFRNSQIISLKTHQEWFNKMLKSESNHILVASLKNGDQIGVIRLDFDKSFSEGEVSINLNPDFRGMGLGFDVLNSCSSFVEENFMQCRKLVAAVKKTNHQSINIFLKAGYIFEKVAGEFNCYCYEID